MYEDLRDRAIANLERRRKRERVMQVITVVMGAVATFLFFIRYLAHPMDRVYFFIPIGIIALAYCIIYTVILGIPFMQPKDIEEEDIEREVAKVYRKYKSSDLQDFSEEEHLELRQIEEVLREGEDFV